MKEYFAKDIRNVGLVGHSGEGKTTLAEAMMYNAGAIDRMGRVEDGNTASDFDQEEINRAISISASLCPVEWNKHKINIIDMPGYFDMIGEVAGGLTAAEGALILVNSISGLGVGSEKAWDYCQKYNLARMFVVNGMDKENANFDKVVAGLKEKYGTAIVPLQFPIRVGHEFKGYVDVLTKKAYEFDGKNAKEVEVPADLAPALEELNEQIIEAAASSDEALMEKYFEEGGLSGAEIATGLKEGLVEGTVVPVLCCSAVNDHGVKALMDSVISLLPSPEEVNPAQPKEGEVKCDTSEPFAGFVFKTIADNFVGKISLVKVVSGTLTSALHPTNPRERRDEKLNHVYTMVGKNLEELKAVNSGDIAALAKLQYTKTGDTLCDPKREVEFPEIEFPAPSYSLAISATKNGEEDKVFTGLHRLEEEDPSFTVAKSTDTNDTLISGQGDLHIGIVVNKLKNKFHVSADTRDPKVAYREAIKKTVEAQGRHKKQTGGHGQFGDVWIKFEPITDGSAEFEFVDKIVGGVVPKGFIPAVEKGLKESIVKGVLAGYPVVNLRATLYDGSYHSVDSSEMAFKTAASLAFKAGLAKANPVILEPIVKAEVIITDDYMGDIIGDLNRRRGRIMGMNPKGHGLQAVVAEVPQAEMFKYAIDLRSMTQGRGSFSMEFARYEEMPPNMAEKVIAEAKKEEDE
jgi:elongation factor G